MGTGLSMPSCQLMACLGERNEIVVQRLAMQELTWKADGYGSSSLIFRYRT